MRNMFTDCKNLTDLDLSSFTTEKKINMAYMFSFCPKITNLDLSSFNTGNSAGLIMIFYIMFLTSKNPILKINPHLNPSIVFGIEMAFGFFRLENEIND